MSLLKGVVVATHPSDHSVDLVLVNNGARLVGVQVCTGACSSRSGTVDLPAVPDKKDKWDISTATEQEIFALVDYVGRTPIVTGFLMPQINQMLFDDPKMRFFRHQSDVMSSIDGDGNISIQHPGGAFIQIGESPEKPDLASKNTDSNLKPDRNTGKKVFLRVALAGNVAELTLTPTGSCTLKLQESIDIEATGHANITCNDATVKALESVTLDTPEARCTGNMTVDGMLTYKGGMKGSGGSSTAVFEGSMEIDGDVHATGDMLNDGANSNHHSH